MGHKGKGTGKKEEPEEQIHTEDISEDIPQDTSMEEDQAETEPEPKPKVISAEMFMDRLLWDAEDMLQSWEVTEKDPEAPTSVPADATELIEPILVQAGKALETAKSFLEEHRQDFTRRVQRLVTRSEIRRKA